MNETVSGEALGHEIINRQEHAWNAGDGEAFAAPFADDADFVNVLGEHHRGRTTIAAGHQGIFDTVYRGSSVRCRLVQAKRVADGVIVVHYRSDLSVPAGPLAGEHHAVPSFVLVRGGDGWKITSFQNTLIAGHP
jgi:uncharacterized protein (TIGR02246 family)